ncbi:MAG: peptidylprolyl isomerase [Desulfuromonadales bacterium]|nr:peptidylprolyl isomerase [Desulfuromonadales bacterium]
MMKTILLTILTASLLLASPVFASERVVIETNYGDITLELDSEKAPLSVANFLAYADAGHYTDTIFHRVIKDFMIQGGNFSAEMVPKQTREQIKNEAGNGLRNRRGTIAMARTGVVDSATSQFFINLKDNGFLDHKNTSTQGYGYAVFGKVVNGMEVVDKIAASPTHTYKRFSDVPVEPVVIRSVKRTEQQ